MHQLQAWAEEERYDFEGKRFKTPYGWVDYDQLEPVSVQMTRAKEQGYRITQEGLDAIRYVLDGTIQVWRPVDKYEMPMYEYIMVRLDPKAKHSIGKGTCPYFIGRFNDSHSDENEFFLERPREGDYLSEYLGEATLHGGTVTDGGEFSIERHEITHWQPLPQPPQEVK
jgi:hypothetical protein